VINQSNDGARRSLEEEFFARQNQELLQKLRVQKNREESKAQLSQYSGIKDDAVLEHLLNQNIQPSTMVALALVPLVLTAWADGVMDPQERKAILQAMNEYGIDAQHPAHELLQSWLTEMPNSSLFETWRTYVKGLAQSMDPNSFDKLKIQIMQRTRAVAEAAGGLLGLGSKISPAEKEQLTRLEAAFS
jgi:hypothetical protein